MYKAQTAEQLKTHFDLPENYSVEGLLSYGSYDEQKHFDKLHATLTELGIQHSSKKLSGRAHV